MRAVEAQPFLNKKPGMACHSGLLILFTHVHLRSDFCSEIFLLLFCPNKPSLEFWQTYAIELVNG